MISSIQKFYRKYRFFIIIVGLLVSLALPLVITSNYIIGIFVRILFYIVLASSLNLINGYSGQFNIGHAGFVLIGSYTEAILATKFGMNFWILLPLAGGCNRISRLVGFIAYVETKRHLFSHCNVGIFRNYPTNCIKLDYGYRGPFRCQRYS